MKLGTRARYSMRMMMAVARLSADGRPVGLGKVAARCGVSRRYLEQLVPALRNAKLVRSVAGRGGGYTLARGADEIKVGAIIEAAIGTIAVTECAAEPESCIHSPFCNCQALWALINHQVTRVVGAYTLADILEPGWPSRVRRMLATDGRRDQATAGP